MKIGFIGTGNMASAFIGGLLKAKILQESELFLCDASQSALDALTQKYPGINTSTDNSVFLPQVDYLILAVKPHIYAPVIAQIKDKVSDETIIITIAAGQTIEKVSNAFGKSIKLVRTMPNTPALVGAGMTAYCPNEKVSEEELLQVRRILGALGRAEALAESLFDGFTALCGSSPAYIYMLIEAMADGAVKEGIPRTQAYTMASQAVLGSAKMVLETGTHPGQLKDQVCSPGGSTIDAVCALEKSGFRHSIMDAVEVCAEKSRKMSQK